jgi:uncharacterized protein (DUF488 family)
MPPAKIWTIGYEGATQDALVAALKKAGIRALVDTRAVPLSRKPGFSKNKLASRLEAEGIAYAGLKGLGTPPSGREAARKGRTGEMKRIYHRHLASAQAQADLEEAIRIARERPACLLCFEHEPGRCHRLLVAEEISRRTGQKIMHLDPLAAPEHPGI